MPRPPAYDRADLIERARDLFWRQGYAGTSMKDLERGLDLRPGSLYAAFKSKEGLYGLALDRYAQDGAARLADLRDRHGPLGALKAHLRGMAAGEGPVRACMLVKTLLETREGALAERADANLASMEVVFASLFREAQDEGDVHPDRDPLRLARRYQSDVIGLRTTLERPGVDGAALAEEIAADLDRLAEPP